MIRLLIIVSSLLSTRAFSSGLGLRKVNEKAFTSTMRTRVSFLQAVNITDNRWDRAPSYEAGLDEPCILTIHNRRYNLTAWANEQNAMTHSNTAHPGGASILQKFNGKNATKAFHAAQHSQQAIEMLQDFLIDDDPEDDLLDAVTARKSKVPRWRAKLFTREDPIGVHKYLGIFCLLHFAFRFYQMYFQDISAGLGSRMGKGPSWIPVLCLAPHALLSVSSMIFHTVPRTRVVGKPMIWKEYRIHNIGFGLRSVAATLFASLAVRFDNPLVRSGAVVGSCLASLAALVAADIATEKLRPGELESTTATMPYWEGCSTQTQRRFKSFYAYSQFMATLACVATGNPGWPLSVLLAIQLASLLMTLVRKGLLSTKGYHYLYTASLIAPYFVGLRSLKQSPLFIVMVALATAMYQLRRRGINKYALWIPVLIGRVIVGDSLLDYGWY